MKAYWDSLTKEQQGSWPEKLAQHLATYGWFSMAIKKPVLCWLKNLSNTHQVQLRNLT